MSLAEVTSQAPEFETALSAFRTHRYTEAVSILIGLVTLDPNDFESRHVLALCLRALGQRVEAVTHLERVVEESPDDHEAWSNYGALLRELGRIDEALTCLSRSVTLKPDNPIAFNNLGSVWLDLHNRDRARECFEQAIKLSPQYCEPHANLARCSLDDGDLAMAKRRSSTAVALDPKNSEAHNNLSFVQAACGDVEGCLNSVTKARELAPNNDMLWSNWLLRALGSSSVSSQTICEQAKIWGQRRASTPALCDRPVGEVERIGIVSGDFRDHPVGQFVAPVIERISKHVEVICYSTIPVADRVTDRIEASCAEFRVMHRTPSLAFAQAILDDHVDVLIDLAGHTGHNRLDVFAHRPAPRQLTWLGYSGTTGLPQMDGLVADSVLINPAEEGFYSESVLRMPDSFLCTEPQGVLPHPKATDPIFGVFNNPSKFSEVSYRMWARILCTLPKASLLFKYQYSGDPLVQRQIMARLCNLGVDPRQITFAPFATRSEHLAIVSSVTAALDTFPYSGATTTLDCLTSGVPVITLAGDRYSSKMTASLLTCAGQSSTIAITEDNYVQVALESTESSSFNGRESFLASPLCNIEKFSNDFLTLLSK